MSDPFLGEIRMIGFNFTPQGWAMCDGQLLSIAQNTALFALLGTTYGGDGQSTFALPDLRGRVAMHAGNGPGLTNRPLGQRSGSETVSPTITTSLSDVDEAHTHELAGGTVGAGVASTSVGTVPTAGSANSSTTHTTLQPYLAIHFIIALVGIFPSQS